MKWTPHACEQPQKVDLQWQDGQRPEGSTKGWDCSRSHVLGVTGIRIPSKLKQIKTLFLIDVKKKQQKIGPTKQ